MQRNSEKSKEKEIRKEGLESKKDNSKLYKFLKKLNISSDKEHVEKEKEKEKQSFSENHVFNKFGFVKAISDNNILNKKRESRSVSDR